MCCLRVSVAFASLVFAFPASNALVADDGRDQVASGRETPTFRDRSIEHWVERLRQGPVAELNEAGEKALPVWIEAARDPLAIDWVRHAMRFQFRDDDWVGPVHVAMFDLPGPLYRHLAIGELASRPEVAQKVASDIIRQARLWSQSDDPEKIDLVDSMVQVLIKLELPAEQTTELVKEFWPSETNARSLRQHLLELLARSGLKSVVPAIDIFLEFQCPLRELRYFTDHIDTETMAVVISESRHASVRRRRLAAAMIANRTAPEMLKADQLAILDELDRLLQDSDLDIRRYAVEGVIKLKGTDRASQLIPTLEKLLVRPESQSQTKVASALASFGPLAMPSIRRAAKSDDPEMRRIAASTLSELASLPDEGLEILLSLTKDENPRVRNYAVFFLGETRSSDPRVVDALTGALDDAKTEQWATRALGELGQNAEEAMERVKSKLQSDDPCQRLQAATAIWAISKNAELVLPVAWAVVRDDQGITSSGYSVTYRNIDGKRVEQRKPFQYPLAARAAELLGQMGPQAAPAVDDLIAMLEHDNWRARSAAMEALGEIGPAATKAIPALERLVEKGAPQQTQEIIEKIKTSRGNAE